MQLVIKRASLEAAITIVNALHRGNKTDPPKNVTLHNTEMRCITETSSSAIPLTGTGIGHLTLLFKDLSNALPVLDDASEHLTFTLENDSVTISDDKGGKLLLTQAWTKSEADSEHLSQISQTVAFASIKTLAEAFDKASLIISSDHPEYEALFLLPDNKMAATDTTKVLFSNMPNYRLYNASILRIPWRLARALNAFYALDKSDMSVTINTYRVGEDLFKEAKINRSFWLATKADEQPATIIEKALDFKGNFTHSLVFNRSRLASNFSQLSKYLSKEEKPYVTVTIDGIKLVMSATPRAAGALTKMLHTEHGDQSDEIKFYLHPKHMTNALNSLTSEYVQLSFSDDNAEPIEITPSDSRHTQVLVAKMRYPDR